MMDAGEANLFVNGTGRVTAIPSGWTVGRS